MFKPYSIITFLVLISLMLVPNNPAQFPAGISGTSYYLVRIIEPEKLSVVGSEGLAFNPAVNQFYLTGSYNRVVTAKNPLFLAALKLYEEDLAGFSTSTQYPTFTNGSSAYDETTKSLFIVNSSGSRILQVPANVYGGVDLTSQTVRTFSLKQLGLSKVAGLTFDPSKGRIYFLDPIRKVILNFLPDFGTRVPGFLTAKDGQINTIPLNQFQPGELVGLTLNMDYGTYFVLSSPKHTLYEINPDGQTNSFTVLSNLNLQDPKAILFAANSDPTDQPDLQNLYILDGGGNRSATKQALPSRLLEIKIESPAVTTFSLLAPLASLQATLVNTVNTFGWSPPSPDPAGITYLPGSNLLLVSDSEVDEMSNLFTGKNIYFSTLNGTLVGTCTTLPFSYEPDGAAINSANGHIYYSDDDAGRIWEVDPGIDGKYCTSDDKTSSINSRLFNSYDPEGVAYGQGDLFIADGEGSQVYIVSPGTNGIFDGIAPGGDDKLTNFDTSVLNISDPEGIEYYPENGTILIISSHESEQIIVETSLDGTLVNSYDISAVGSIRHSGLAFAPSSQNPSVNHIYLASRGVDNNEDPNENDGKLYEIALPSTSPLVTPTPTTTSSTTATSNPGFTSTATLTSTLTITPTLSFGPSATLTPMQGSAFWDDFDPIKESWTHSAKVGVDDWSPSTTYSHSPTTSFYSSEPATPKDDSLMARAILIPAGALLTFWHTYQTELNADGAVIEISIDGGLTYADLGSKITGGGYTGSITSNTNPIYGRQAWTGGTIGTWSQVTVDLSSYAGQSVILKFRNTADNGKAVKGWYIDDIRVSGSGMGLTSTPTSTSLPSPSATSTPTGTITSTPTGTPTPTQTSTPTVGLSPSSTTTVTNTATSSPSPTILVTLTSTVTPSPTATVTPSFPPTATYTPLSTRTSTTTRTNTLTPTLTQTPTNSITPPSGAIFWDDFDPVKESWTHSAVKGVDDWAISTTRAHSPTHSYFCSEPATPKDDFLVMRPVLLPANAQLTFWHTYQMESRADAAVLEISVDGGITYMDLGPRILSGGYNNSITSNTSPIFGRQAWTGGTIGTWSQVIVDLGNYAGQSAIIRFRSTADNGKAGKGWFIDDIRISG
jgi:hypothetical protein